MTPERRTWSPARSRSRSASFSGSWMLMDSATLSSSSLQLRRLEAGAGALKVDRHGQGREGGRGRPARRHGAAGGGGGGSPPADGLWSQAQGVHFLQELLLELGGLWVRAGL